MCVGDCTMTSFGNAKPTEKKNAVDGHSFGILLYRSATLQGSVVLETTGYESKQEQKRPSLAVAQNMKRILGMVDGDSSKLCMRITLSAEQEDHLYVKTYAGVILILIIFIIVIVVVSEILAWQVMIRSFSHKMQRALWSMEPDLPC